MVLLVNNWAPSTLIRHENKAFQTGGILVWTQNNLKTELFEKITMSCYFPGQGLLKHKSQMAGDFCVLIFFRRSVDKRWNGYGTSCMPFASLARIAYLCLVLIGSLRQLRCCDWLNVLLCCWFYRSHLKTTPLLLVKWLSLKATCCFLIDFLLFFFFFRERSTLWN